MTRACVVGALARALAIAVLVASASAASNTTVGTVPNKFIVRFGSVFNPQLNFFTMPRTTEEAKKDGFAQAAVRASDKTTIWCRQGDHRICVLFDQKGSVAGLQESIETIELTKAGNAPPLLNILAMSEVRQDTLLGKKVFAITVFFVSKAVLLAGGRTLTANTHTAPQGLYVLQTDIAGRETARLHVSTSQSQAEGVGLNEQACYNGMGKHYFLKMTTSIKCENIRPFFTLYGPQTKQLQGFGLGMFGKPTQGRGWFESVPSAVAKAIAPNSPPCLVTWIDKYSFFTHHVFFVDKPWLTKC